MEQLKVKALRRWKERAKPETPLTPSPPRWRSLFNQCLEALGIQEWGFRPYSLRRGGATFWFQKHQNLDRILIQGRWHTQRSARIYLNEGLSVLSQLKIPASDKRLKPYILVYRNFLAFPKFSTLEPPSGRAGGSGKKRSKRQKKRVPLFKLLSATVCV